MCDKENGIKIIREQGYPVYMDTEYCKNYIAKNSNCNNCEYKFSCDEVLLQILRLAVNKVRIYLAENEELPEEINKEECRLHRDIIGNCSNCKNDNKCYLFALIKYQEIKKI